MARKILVLLLAVALTACSVDIDMVKLYGLIEDNVEAGKLDEHSWLNGEVVETTPLDSPHACQVTIRVSDAKIWQEEFPEEDLIGEDAALPTNSPCSEFSLGDSIQFSCSTFGWAYDRSVLGYLACVPIP